MEGIGTLTGFVLTLMIFSYLLGDNILYRAAVYIFVGLAAGFITIVTWDSVLGPWFRQTIGSGLETGNFPAVAIGMTPVLLGVLILLKTSSRLGGLGNLAIAIIIGVGAAVGIVGAVTGTLIPLVQTTSSTSTALLDSIVIVVGVVTTLIYFQYVAQRTPDEQTARPRAIQALSIVGEGFILIALATLYAGAILTSLAIFSERLSFLLMGGG